MGQRVPALDGVRGLAIAMVVVGHYTALTGLRLGVDLFFVLSGYLITGLLVREFEQRGRIDLRRFYGRRVRRLLPALIPVLLVGWIGIRLFDAPGRVHDDLVALASGGAYLGNWWLANTGHPVEFSFLWTLSQEEQFYLLWPALLIGALALGRRRLVLWLLVAAIASEVGYRVALTAAGADWLRIYAGGDTHIDGLLIGCLIALAWAWLPMLRARASAHAGRLTLWGLVGLAAAGTGLTVWWSDQGNAWLLDGFMTLTAIAGGATVGGATQLRDGWLLRFFTHPVMRRLGVISYAAYLWNEPVKAAGDELVRNAAAVPIEIAATLLIAELSWRLIESRFLGAIRLVQPVQGAPAASREVPG